MSSVWTWLFGAMPMLIAATALAWRWASLRSHLRGRQQALDQERQRLQRRSDQLRGREAELEKQRERLSQQARRIEGLRLEVSRRSKGLAAMQRMFGEMFEEGRPAAAVGEEQRTLLAVGVCGNGSSQTKWLRPSAGQPLAVELPSLEAAVQLAAGLPESATDGWPSSLYLILRHRESGYVRVLKVAVPCGREAPAPGTRVQMGQVPARSLHDQRRWGVWDAFLVTQGRLNDRVELRIEPSEQLVLATLKVVSAQVGVVCHPDGSIRQLGQSTVEGSCRGIFPYLKIVAVASRRRIGLRATLDDQSGRALACCTTHVKPEGGQREWIAKLPLDALTLTAGSYCLRWTARLTGQNGPWRELASHSFRIVPGIDEVDQWLDPEGELKPTYAEKLTDVRQMAEQILAGLS